MEYVSVDKEICCVANLIRKEFDNLVFGSVYSEERITRMNIWIIDYIYDKKGEDVFQKDIERKMSITRSTASKIIDLMVQKKLVERSAVGYDARLKKLTLTPKALKLRDEMEKNSKKVYEKVMAGFSEEEEQLLLSYILRIKGNMDSGA
ncbi:MAG: MarR family winged helix-turn-helix transcriptional regulator [Lachnospiraceae bacterium]|jgi:Transcriptional regulators